MLSTIVDQYGWIVLIVAVAMIWMIVKLVRNVVFKLVGLAFAIISLVRIWAFFSA